jgi:hypothetical protein
MALSGSQYLTYPRARNRDYHAATSSSKGRFHEAS